MDVFYYWKDFESDIEKGKIGWLKSNQDKLNGLKERSPDYVWAFKTPAGNKGKLQLLCQLKWSEKSLVKVDVSKSREEIKSSLFYDPNESIFFDGTESEEAIDQITEILKDALPSSAFKGNFQGINGQQTIESNHAKKLQMFAKKYKQIPLNDKQHHEKVNDETSFALGVNAQKSISTEEQNRFEVETKGLCTAEREAIVKVRYGQGSFRDALIKINGEKCWMTGLEGKQLLIASHIKPWSHSEESRGNINNGLLLSALWDSAFDSGLITFDENWDVILSSNLSESAKDVLNIKCFNNLPEIYTNDKRKCFLSYHREHVFEKCNSES